MKKLIKVATIIIFCFAVISCSKDTSESQTGNASNPLSSKLTAPNGLVISKSIESLNQEIFNNKVQIIDLNYIDTPKDYKGFAVEITYINENNIQESVFLLRNIEKFNYDASDGISINNTFYGIVPNQGDIFVRCEGSGCCYPSGTINMNTGEMTYSCKCEGNPGGNSGCIVKITHA